MVLCWCLSAVPVAVVVVVAVAVSPYPPDAVNSCDWLRRFVFCTASSIGHIDADRSLWLNVGHVHV